MTGNRKLPGNRVITAYAIKSLLILQFSQARPSRVRFFSAFLRSGSPDGKEGLLYRVDSAYQRLQTANAGCAHRLPTSTAQEAPDDFLSRNDEDSTIHAFPPPSVGLARNLAIQSSARRRPPDRHTASSGLQIHPALSAKASVIHHRASEKRRS